MLAVVLSLAALAVPSPPIASADLAACRSAAPTPAVRHGRLERPRRLGELPPARQHLAVIRRVGDCFVASVVGYDPVTRRRVVTLEPAARFHPQDARTRRAPGG